MTLDQLLLSQLLDPFRIGLLIALVVTTYNTAGTVGVAVPLVLGAVFVAVLIAITMQSQEVATMTAILTGLAANAILVGIILAVRAAWKHFSATGKG
jgi:hypothetical protein